VILVLGSFLYHEITWLERIADLADRLGYASGLLIKNQPVQDTILFVVFMALLFWITGLLAGYALARSGSFIGAVVPAGVVLVIVQLYDLINKSSDNILVIYLILSLLLLGRLTYIQKRFRWKVQRVSTVAESRTDLNITFIVLAFATVLLVWLAPTSMKSFSEIKTAWEKLSRPMRVVQNNLGHAVAGLQVPGKVGTLQFYGDTLSLGRQAALGDTAYLRVQTPLVNNSSRYYWRVRSYNIYKNDQWFAEDGSSTILTQDHALITLADPVGITSKFTFTALSMNLAELVSPARPVWVSPPTRLFFFQVSPGKMDPVEFVPGPTILAGEQYSVRANEYVPTVAQLRSAGEGYPDWVTRHYLQMPGALPQDIVALARQITAGARTPYDKAAAVTSYLRSNIDYSSTVDVPPPGRDPLEWFLFGSRHGFCNYYATAEVILLRAVGIPARLVVGFAQGEFVDPDYYVIRQRDSHAWPEVYFPGAGWVEFEPTISQPPLVLPPGLDFASAGQVGDQPLTGLGDTGHATPAQGAGKKTGLSSGTTAVLLLHLLVRGILVWMIIVTVLLLYTYGMFDRILGPGQSINAVPMPVLLKRFFEKRAWTPPGWLLRWAYLAELNPIERSFTTVYRSLRWLGEKANASQTPAEAARLLSGLLPDVTREIDSLLEEYQRDLFSHKHGYQPVVSRSAKKIRQEAWRVALQQRVSRLRGKFKP
jgi:hypothetical protein